MIKDLKMLMENDKIPYKLKLLFNISLNKVELVDKDNSVKGLPFDLEEIKMIQKLNLSDFLIFLYINKKEVHNKLYDNDKLLEINFEINNKKISQYIYLCFLIGKNEMIDYQYIFELINKLNDIQRGEKEKILKKIIMAKMILLLIDNYKQILDNEDNKNNKHKEELNEIFNFNLKLLYDKDNKIKLEQYKLKLEDLRSKKIEEIYLIIIKYLIENSKLEDSDFTENIVKQTELESIILSKLMLVELTKILTKEKEYIKKYKIKNFEDIFYKKKINFYYNLIKYIIKQSLYIYQIPFLLETRKTILNLIKFNLEKLSFFIKNSNYKYQIEYILKQFIGDNSYIYYYETSKSIIKNSQSHNNSQKSNNYGSNSSIFNTPSVQEEHENMINGFGTSTNDSSSISPFSHNSYNSEKEKSKRDIYNEFENGGYNINELQYKILSKSKFFLHTNKKGQTPFFIYDEIKIIINEKENENKTIQDIRNATTNDERLSNNYKKFLLFLDNFERFLSNEFINNYKLKIILNFDTQKINNNDFEITCLYDIEIPGEDIQHFKDIDILGNGLGEGYRYILSEINNTSYSNKEYS